MKKITLLLLFLSNFIYSQSLIKTYYDPLFKTKLKEVYQVKTNTPIINGYYKQYDEFGYLLVHRNYVNNKQNGKSTSYYGAHEASLMSDNVKNKALGEISGVFNYKDNQLHGIQKKYNYTKQGTKYLQFKEVYDNGDQIELNEYYPNSNLALHSVYNGVCTSYYEDGSKNESFNSVNGVYQGTYTFWYKSGQIMEEGQMKNGERNGFWTLYNEDGTIKNKIEFDMGKRLPTEEEKEIARQKELVKAKKEKEKRKLLEEKRLAEQKEAVQKKRIEEEKLALTKKLKQQSENYERQKENVEGLYKVEDLIQSKLLNETVYKYKKKHLYNAYLIAEKYITSEIRNTNDLKEKSSLLNLGLKITEKMKELRNGKSKDLEKKLKTINEPIEVIETLGLKK